MNEATIRSALLSIENALATIHAELRDVAVAPPGAPSAQAAAKGEPLGIDSQDVREWSDAVAATTLRDYTHAFEQRKTGVVSPWDALALYANRPETSAAEMETIRASRKRLAGMFNETERYDVAIPRVLAANAALSGDPHQPGFLTGEGA